jgi:hypothetical protein
MQALLRQALQPPQTQKRQLLQLLQHRPRAQLNRQLHLRQAVPQLLQHG